MDITIQVAERLRPDPKVGFGARRRRLYQELLKVEKQAVCEAIITKLQEIGGIIEIRSTPNMDMIFVETSSSAYGKVVKELPQAIVAAMVAG